VPTRLLYDQVRVLYDQVRGFYSLFDFEDLPFDPKRGMIVRILDLKHAGRGGE